MLANTTGFTTGIANSAAIPTGTGIPLCINRRINGTPPHSPTGKNIPIRLPASTPENGLRGSQRAKSSRLIKTSTKPDATVPISKNGTASMKIPKKTAVKLLAPSNNASSQPGRLPKISPTLAVMEIATRSSVPQIGTDLRILRT